MISHHELNQQAKNNKKLKQKQQEVSASDLSDRVDAWVLAALLHGLTRLIERRVESHCCQELEDILVIVEVEVSRVSRQDKKGSFEWVGHDGVLIQSLRAIPVRTPRDNYITTVEHDKRETLHQLVGDRQISHVSGPSRRIQ
jgi:hypothetical protein